MHTHLCANIFHFIYELILFALLIRQISLGLQIGFELLGWIVLIFSIYFGTAQNIFPLWDDFILYQEWFCNKWWHYFNQIDTHLHTYFVLSKKQPFFQYVMKSSIPIIVRNKHLLAIIEICGLKTYITL